MASKEKVYRTDKLTFLSYGLLIVAYALFIAVIVKRAGGFSSSMLILFLFVLPVLAYFFFLFKKSVKITEEGIEVFGLTGRKKIRWEEIASVSLTPGRKYFLFIESKDGKLAVVDDSTENFVEVAREVKRRAPVKLPENYDKLLDSYRRSYTSIGILLFAALVLIFVAVKSLI
jgi:Ca2+/Na+ antiporter